MYAKPALSLHTFATCLLLVYPHSERVVAEWSLKHVFHADPILNLRISISGNEHQSVALGLPNFQTNSFGRQTVDLSAYSSSTNRCLGNSYELLGHYPLDSQVQPPLIGSVPLVPSSHPSNVPLSPSSVKVRAGKRGTSKLNPCVFAINMAI